jgi:acyl transferase domain-containing protein
MNARPMPADAAMPRCFLFAGQGSQYYRMGLDLHREADDFRDNVERLDALIAARSGISPLAVVSTPGRSVGDPFDHHEASGLAIYLVERALAVTLAGRGVQPAVVLGSSIGMLAAAATAGAIDDEAAIALALASRQVFDSHAPRGGMLAVLHDPAEYYRDVSLSRLAELAGINFGGGFVLAAAEENLPRLEQHLAARGLPYQRLPVRHAYHSSLIEPVRAAFLQAVRAVPLRMPSLPLYCCSQVRRLASFTADDMWLALRNPLQHEDTLRAADRAGPYRFVDLSPSGTLAALLRFVLPSSSQSTGGTILDQFQNGAAQRLARA